MSQTLVQSISGNSASGSTSVTGTLSAGATAGNIIWCAVGIDKTSGALTTPSGFTTLFAQDSASVSTYVGYKVAAGGETAVTLTWTTAAPAGAIMWLDEYSDTNTSGVWTILGSANHPTDETTAATWSSGTTAATTAQGQGLAWFSIDSSSTATAPTYSNSFVSLHAYAGGAGKGDMAVAALADVAAGTAAETTMTYSGTADQHAGAIAVFAKISGGASFVRQRPGQTWQRRFRHQQQLSSSVVAVADVAFAGVTAALVLAAPTGSVSVTLPGVTGSVILAAPAGAVSVSINAPTATVVFTAPAGTISTSLPGVTATLVLAAPAGKVAVALPGATGTVVFAAPAGAVSVTLPGVTATVVFAAPVGNFTTGSGFNANGVTATVVLAAPAGRVAVTLPGATAAVVLAARVGAVAVPFSAAGVTARLVLAAVAGGVDNGAVIVPVTVTGSDRASTTVTGVDRSAATVAGGDRATSGVTGSDRPAATVSGSDRPTSTVS